MSFFILLIDNKLYLIPFVVFPWLFVILDLGLCLLQLNAILFQLYPTILCWDLTGFALATPILISRLVLCLYRPTYQYGGYKKYPVGTISWLGYLVILLCVLNLLLWTLFERRLLMVQLLGSHLSVCMSRLMSWGHVVLLPVGSLGMPRLTFGMIYVLSLPMYLKCC